MLRTIDVDHACRSIAACGAANFATGERIKEVAQGYSASAVAVGYAKGIDDALGVLSNMPIINTMKQGDWVYGKNHGEFVEVRCSACCGVLLVKWYSKLSEYRYCPRCGADMRVSK